MSKKETKIYVQFYKQRKLWRVTYWDISEVSKVTPSPEVLQRIVIEQKDLEVEKFKQRNITTKLWCSLVKINKMKKQLNLNYLRIAVICMAKCLTELYINWTNTWILVEHTF